jgi:hypothetical protein
MDLDDQKIKDFIHSIEAAYTSTDNEQRRFAEQQLFTQILQQPHLLQYVIVLIVTVSAPERVKEMAAIFLT